MRIEDLCTFGILQHTTTSRPGRSPTRIEVAKYNIDTAICPLSCLKAYIARTKELRVEESKLFILAKLSHIKLCLGTPSEGGPRLLLTCANVNV